MGSKYYTLKTKHKKQYLLLFFCGLEFAFETLKRHCLMFIQTFDFYPIPKSHVPWFFQIFIFAQHFHCCFCLSFFKYFANSPTSIIYPFQHTIFSVQILLYLQTFQPQPSFNDKLKLCSIYREVCFLARRQELTLEKIYTYTFN